MCTLQCWDIHKEEEKSSKKFNKKNKKTKKDGLSGRLKDDT